MLYTAYELGRRAGAPALASYDLTARALKALPRQDRQPRSLRRIAAFCDVMAHARPTHTRPAFGIDSVEVAGRLVAVRETPTRSTPFATQIHFSKPGVTGQPTVLVVGPMSGHFTTLIAPTIRTLLADHDVHVLDWHNARDIPVDDGRFGLEEYIEHVMDALHKLGPGTHVVAVCQPAVPVLAAVALLAARDDDAQPASVTLMAGPIDARINPNRVNHLAETRPISFFERRLITTVPRPYRGTGRRVYPGFLQLTAFMSMNRARHLRAHLGMYRALVNGDTAKAAATRAFYDEYGAVMDVPAEFYLDTVSEIFQQHLLARGELRWRGELVDPALIRRSALLTVEGENDDICSPGQTLAAHDLCTGIARQDKMQHLQPGVGHYGVFSGSKWQQEIYPVLRSFIASHESAVLQQQTLA